MYQVLPAAGHREMPWHNGGGSTAEIARFPAGDVPGELAWRVSLARIAEPGVFSELPGLDRILMPVGDAGLSLRLDGTKRLLEPREQVAFAGELAVSAELPFGPTRCLNLMTRRGGPVGTVTVLTAGAHTPLAVRRDETAILVALSAGVDVHGREDDRTARLDVFDAVLATGPDTLTVTGAGAVAAVTVAADPPDA